MSQHRNKLHAYLFDVTRDLLQRGAIKQKTGQSLADILKSETTIVLGEVSSDLTAVLKDVGVGLVSAGSKVLENYATRGIENLGKAFGDMLRGNKR